ncbi:MAG TPA: hypothetical protein PK691_05525, partial [Thermomicrobiales bacterium]|nr:hypothetical protein [Thermomicrobiales bacterium]
VAAHISWDQLTQVVPDRMIGFAVAGATAINLIPQTMRTVSSIREACTGRGMRSTRGRDLAFLMTPILTSGLDRSMQLAEVLEARGFGATSVETGQHRSRSAIGWVVMLSGLTMLAYALLARIEWGIGIGLILSVSGFAAVFSFREAHAIGRTRYRVHPLGSFDWLVIACAVSAPITAAMLAVWRPELFTWSPYPAMVWPTFSVGIVLPSLLLMIPMLVAELGNSRD